MSARYVRRKVEERPTREMARDELLGLLSAAELETARKKRATIPPPLPTASPGTEEPFSIDTRELDVRVFRKHALDLGRSAPVVAIGTMPPATVPAGEVAPAEESTEMVAPRRGRVVVWTTLLSIAVTSLVLLFLALSK